ncbi:MAG: CARDB domain-containing protein [bacterium]
MSRSHSAAAAESAFLLARRDLSTLLIKEGESLTITVEVHNAGDGEATNVKVSDAEWDAHLFETTGDISATFDSIAPGVTKTYSFSVVPSVTLNRFEQPEMTISYDTNGQSISAKGPVEHIKVWR